jgi:hypothetical protein
MQELTAGLYSTLLADKLQFLKIAYLEVSLICSSVRVCLHSGKTDLPSFFYIISIVMSKDMFDVFTVKL